MKGVFLVVAIGAMVLDWLIMVAFIFAQFGGWGFVALGLTPFITGGLGPPLLWLVYGVPTIALWAWAVMVVSGVLWAIVPEGKNEGSTGKVVLVVQLYAKPG